MSCSVHVLLLLLAACGAALRLTRPVGRVSKPERNGNNCTLTASVQVDKRSKERRTIVFHVGADAGVQLSVGVSQLNAPNSVAAFARLRFRELVEFVDLNGLAGFQRGDYVIGRWPLERAQFSQLRFNDAADADDLIGVAVTAGTWRETLVGWKSEWNARLAQWTANFSSAQSNLLTPKTPAFGSAGIGAAVDDEARLADMLALTTLQAVAKSDFAATKPKKRQIAINVGATLDTVKQAFASDDIQAKMKTVKAAMRSAVRHQQACVDKPGKECAPSAPLLRCDDKRLIVFDARCCPLCDPVALERTFESTKPSKRAAERLEFDFSVQASSSGSGKKAGAKLQLDASTIKFSLQIRNPELSAREVGLPSSIGVRFSIDVKAEYAAPFKALPPRSGGAQSAQDDERALWASEDGTWAVGGDRFDLEADETALQLNSGASDGVPQLVLAWQTWALVNNCRVANDQANVSVTTYRSLNRYAEKEKWSVVPLQPEQLATTSFFASIDLSSCTLRPTAIVIDPNVAVVTEGEQEPCDDDLSVNCAPTSDGGASTTAIIAGCALAGVAVVVAVVAVVLSRRRRNSFAKGSEGLE